MSEPSRPSLSDRYWRLPWIARIGIVGAGVVAVVVVGAQIARNSPDRPAPSRPAAAAPAPASQPTAAALPAGQIGPGVWFVGTDVQPGTYRSSGPAEADRYCMWSRHDTTEGGPMDGIIASDGTFDAGQMVVTIEPGDALFRTSGCAPWERAG